MVKYWLRPISQKCGIRERGWGVVGGTGGWVCAWGRGGGGAEGKTAIG